MVATQAQAPNITVTPTEALVDVPVDIRVNNLAPGQNVTIQAQVQLDGGKAVWESRAEFVADEQGSVRVAEQAPIAGSYDSVDPNGLIWSLAPAEGTRPTRGLQTGIEPYTIQFDAIVNGQPVATAEAVRHAVASDVTVREVRENGLFANVFLPAGTGPFPTIIVVSGSGGGFADGAAALLASHGYAAVSLAYFGIEGLPAELINIPLEYFEQAISWIKNHPELDSDNLAISGTSRGGELALLLASRYPELKNVIAYVPSGYSWGAVAPGAEEDPGDAFPSWTYGGQPLPYVARVRNDDVEPEADGSLTLTPAFLRYLENTEREQAAAIEVERINGPILLISGTDDDLWPSEEFSRRIVERLNRAGFTHPVEHLSYEGAGHTIGTPYAPTTVNRGPHTVRQAVINLGGSPAANARARAESWARILEFLKEHLPAPARQNSESVLQSAKR